jgi:hypothetical protein
MDPVERLVAIEQIKQLKARYFRCVDTKDWTGLAEVFAPDAVMDMSGEMPKGMPGGGITNGNEAIAAFVRDAGRLDLATTVHHGHMPEIDVTSEGTATGVWAMEDELWWPDPYPVEHIHAYGHYHETYQRVGGEWRIASTRLTRLKRIVKMR